MLFYSCNLARLDDMYLLSDNIVEQRWSSLTCPYKPDDRCVSNINIALLFFINRLVFLKPTC